MPTSAASSSTRASRALTASHRPPAGRDEHAWASGGVRCDRIPEEQEQTGVQLQGSVSRHEGRRPARGARQARVEEAFPALLRRAGQPELDRLRRGVDEDEESLALVADLEPEAA